MEPRGCRSFQKTPFAGIANQSTAHPQTTPQPTTPKTPVSATPAARSIKLTVTRRQKRPSSESEDSAGERDDERDETEAQAHSVTLPE
ncbi:hypothetical protein PC128_g9161 [Phytophthora cactorum]|nr:hypothetical protein PC120_g8323 [Phytophthora cactorum]KAG3194661.1 hypothetical protein PC128_g9161 [Phytophthora cactorum]KAG4057158.1 hypothetical protein PC123_g7821 [Phytophthora cactorum]